MNYQKAALPEGAVKVGSTPSMTEETVVPGILKKHLAPRGKFGYLVVEDGALQFVWEDDANNVLDADPEHPIVIFPERYHGSCRSISTEPVASGLRSGITSSGNSAGSRSGSNFSAVSRLYFDGQC